MFFKYLGNIFFISCMFINIFIKIIKICSLMYMVNTTFIIFSFYQFLINFLLREIISALPEIEKVGLQRSTHFVGQLYLFFIYFNKEI